MKNMISLIIVHAGNVDVVGCLRFSKGLDVKELQTSQMYISYCQITYIYIYIYIYWALICEIELHTAFT